MVEKTHKILECHVSNDERDIYFFMAYLIQKGSDLPFAVPGERSDYELLDQHRHAKRNRILEVRLPLTSDVTVPVSVQFDGPFEPDDIEQLAEELVADLNRIPLDKDELVQELLELRAHADQVFARLARNEVPARLISFEFDLQEAIRTGAGAYLMTLGQLGSDAKSTVRRVHVYDAETIDGELSANMAEQKALAARASAFAEEGADGAIDVVLLNRLKRHGVDIASLLKSPQELKSEEPLNFPDGEIRLFWELGVLTANMPLTNGSSWVFGRVDLPGEYPDLHGDITGRKLRDFITHPDLPEDLVFASGHVKAGRLENLRAETQYRLFDAKTGRVW